MPTIIDGTIFYSESEVLADSDAEIRRDAAIIGARYRKNESISITA